MNFVVEKVGKQKLAFTEEQKDYIVEQYVNNKYSMKIIGEMFKVASPTIKKILNDKNIEAKAVGSNSIYRINQDYFEVIDTEEKSYWLGFLYADGCVSKDGSFEITLAEIDRNHIVKLTNCLQSNHPIKSRAKTIGDKEFKSNRLYIRNKKLCEDLINKGCIPNKSLILEFPSEIKVPDRLQIDFIRGYIDGDGSITSTTRKGKHTSRTNYKISIAGTEDFLNSIASILNIKGRASKAKKGKHYQLYINGNDQSRKITKLLYDNASIYLDRKKDKADELIKYVEENPRQAWNKGLKLEDY